MKCKCKEYSDFTKENTNYRCNICGRLYPSTIACGGWSWFGRDSLKINPVVENYVIMENTKKFRNFHLKLMGKSDK